MRRKNKKVLRQLRLITETFVGLNEQGRNLALQMFTTLNRPEYQVDPAELSVEQDGGSKPPICAVDGVVSFDVERRNEAVAGASIGNHRSISELMKYSNKAYSAEQVIYLAEMFQHLADWAHYTPQRSA